MPRMIRRGPGPHRRRPPRGVLARTSLVCAPGGLSGSCEGLFAAIGRAGRRVDAVLRVAFGAIGGKPARANFFRVDRSAAHGDEYSAWSPTMKNRPDFHVVAAFGGLIFM